jgi:hypothetical protein
VPLTLRAENRTIDWIPAVRVQLLVSEAPSASSGNPDVASTYRELSPTEPNGLERVVTGVAALTGVAAHADVCPVAAIAGTTPSAAAAKIVTINTPGCRQPALITSQSSPLP